MDRLSIGELLAATAGAAAGNLDRELGFDGVGIDSRALRPGEVFWAVRGERSDGHEYVNQALNRGAVACVVRAGHESSCRGPCVIVPHTLDALWRFARRYRDRQESMVVGVTGSAGKTTTRRMLFNVLSTGFAGFQSPHNYNNHFGVPLSVLGINSDHEFAVLELAASHVGEIRELAKIAAPEIGVVTTIGPAHLEGFGSEEAIRQAKCELLDALPKTGFAVLNGDDAQVRSLAACTNTRVLLVGETDQSDYQATGIELSGSQVDFQVNGHDYRVPVAGRHHLTAALISVAVGSEIGLQHAQINEGLARFRPAAGRCAATAIGSWQVIDDTYNSNPLSMQAAIRLLRDCHQSRRRLLIVGDMLELGPQSTWFHEQLGRETARGGIDRLLTIGRYADDVARGACDGGMPAHCICRADELETLLAVLDCWLESHDAVLVKGSRGMRMETVVEWLRNHPAAKEASTLSPGAGDRHAAA